MVDKSSNWRDFDTLSVVHVCLLGIVFIIAFPTLLIGIYHMSVDWKKRKAYLIKRHPMALVFTIVCLCMNLFGFLPYASMEYLLKNASKACNSYIRVIFNYTPFTAALSIQIVRLWLVYYDINLAKYRLEKAWSSAIETAPPLPPAAPDNSKTNKEKGKRSSSLATRTISIYSTASTGKSPDDVNNSKSNNWFYNHQKTWGNVKYLIGITLIIVFAISATVLGIFHFADKNGASIAAIVMSVYFALTVGSGALFYWKLKNVYFDELFILREMLDLVIFAIPSCIVIIINPILEIKGIYQWEEYCIIHEYAIFYNCLITLIYLTMFAKFKNWISKKETEYVNNNMQEKECDVCPYWCAELARFFGCICCWYACAC